jgi:hypothetical protein
LLLGESGFADSQAHPQLGACTVLAKHTVHLLRQVSHRQQHHSVDTRQHQVFQRLKQYFYQTLLFFADRFTLESITSFTQKVKTFKQ